MRISYQHNLAIALPALVEAHAAVRRVSSPGPDGRQQALSDDLCQCGCSSPPRLVASQTRSYCEV